jgi:type VI secretion system protein VasD
MGAAALAILVVSGCGVGQAVSDSTVDAARWAFTTQVKKMNLDLIGRASLNTTGAGQSLSTVVRIYQLKTPQAFQQLDYAQLQTNDLDALKPDLLATHDVVLRPDTSASISEPMNREAEFDLQIGCPKEAVEKDRSGEDRGKGQHAASCRRRPALLKRKKAR